MPLTPEQKQAVATWVDAGETLSAIQKKLLEEFNLSMTYMDVRFLVDDLDLTLKNAAPKAEASDVSKAPPPPPPPAPTGEDEDMPAEENLDEPAPPDGAPSVRVVADKITLIPGALASGTVTFSDGVTGKWIVDNYGRPGFTEISQPGYRPTPADAQAFMQELSLALQQQGL